MEYTSLYRKFRPMLFSEIVGQEHITQTLKNQVIADRVGHAYLFTGSRGTGKTSAAKVLARAVNCLNPKDGEPCNECEICKAALAGSLTDIVEMDAASNNSVDDIRAIRDEVNFLPTVAKYRVYIIDEVHMLSTGAFNALLKTLEEPPKHVKFILATTEPQKLLATILSRCQRFDFKKIPNEKMVQLLKKICDKCQISITDGALQIISELSEGAARDAESILERCAQENVEKIDEKIVKDLVGIPSLTYVSKIVESILKFDPEQCLKTCSMVIAEGKDITNLLWEMIKYIKDILVYLTTKEQSAIYSEEEKQKIDEISRITTKESLLSTIYALSDLENRMKWSSQKNIMFQVELMKIATQEAKGDLSGLESRIKNLEDKIRNGITKAPEKVQKTSKEEVVQKQRVQINNTNNIQASSKPKQVNVPKEEFWTKVLEQLKEQRKVLLYTNLASSNAIEIDDMTIGIEFPNGLNDFGRSILEKPENMNELKRLVSMALGEEKRIKLLDKNANIQNQKNTKSVQDEKSTNDLGIDINVIDE